MMGRGRATYYICSPGLDQSCVIARLLKRHRPGAEIVGVLFGAEQCRRARCYDRLVRHDTWHNQTLDGGMLVPTGGTSTKLALEKGAVHIGRVTLEQNALRVFDKVWLLSAASSAGLPIPVTWTKLEDVEAWPVFFKGSHEGGRRKGIARTIQDLPAESLNTLIFQEVIGGIGTYGVAFLADSGQLLVSHSHFERESLPKHGGSAVIIEEHHDDRLLDYTRRLVGLLDYSGWGLAEFKYCPRRGDFVLMEVNAKFWASCEFSFCNQPEFLEWLFGLRAANRRARRMVFVNRAIRRGPLFCTKNAYYLLAGCALRVYPESSPSVLSPWRW